MNQGKLEVVRQEMARVIATGGSNPLLCLEGVPGLPGAPQDEAGFMRKFETSHVGGAK